jgi:hypothetical protein
MVNVKIKFRNLSIVEFKKFNKFLSFCEIHKTMIQGTIFSLNPTLDFRGLK